MLQVQLLGGLAVRNGREAEGAAGQRKSLVVLALIASAPAGMSREKLLGYLWPEVPEHRGHNALRQRLFALRRDLNEDALFLSNAELQLNPAVVSVDLWEFNEAFAAGAMERAARAYGGPYLDGMFFKGLPELERWIDDTRRDLSTRATHAFTSVATSAAASGDHAGAIIHWRRLAAMEPTASAPAMGLMAALAAVGDAPAALSHYRLHCSIRREQFDLAPDKSVTALADAIRSAGHRPPHAHAHQAFEQADALSVTSERFEASGPAGELAVATDMASPRVAAAIDPLFAPAPPRQRRTFALLAGAAATIVITLLGTATYGRSRGSDAERTSRRVLVTAFRNETGDAGFDALTNAAATEVARLLTHTGIADVIDGRTALTPLERAQDSATPGREAARRLRAGTMLSGSVRLSGDSLILESTLVEVSTGVIVQATPPLGVLRDSATTALPRMADKVAGTIAAMRDPAFQQVSGGRVTPPNLESFLLFRRGMLALARRDLEGAHHEFVQAFERDTTFAQAALWAADFSGFDSLKILLRYVEQRLDQLTPLDRARYDYMQAFFARDLERAYQATAEMLRLAPTSWNALQLHASLAFHRRRYKEASATYRKIDMNAPGLPNSFYDGAAFAHHQARDFALELRVVEAAIRRDPTDFFLCRALVRPITAMGRLHELESVVARCAALHKNGIAQGRLFTDQMLAPELLVHGHAREADSVWNANVSLAERMATAGEMPPRDLGLFYYDAGRYADALPLLRRGNDAGMGMVRIAVAAAMARDTATAREYTRKVIVQRAKQADRYPYAIAARIAMGEGQHDYALALLTEFERSGGLVANQLYADRIFKPLWNRQEWLAIVGPR